MMDDERRAQLAIAAGMVAGAVVLVLAALLISPTVTSIICAAVVALGLVVGATVIAQDREVPS